MAEQWKRITRKTEDHLSKNVRDVKEISVKYFLILRHLKSALDHKWSVNSLSSNV